MILADKRDTENLIETLSKKQSHTFHILDYNNNKKENISIIPILKKDIHALSEYAFNQKIDFVFIYIKALINQGITYALEKYNIPYQGSHPLFLFLEKKFFQTNAVCNKLEISLWNHDICQTWHEAYHHLTSYTYPLIIKIFGQKKHHTHLLQNKQEAIDWLETWFFKTSTPYFDKNIIMENFCNEPLYETIIATDGITITPLFYAHKTKLGKFIYHHTWDTNIKKIITHIIEPLFNYLKKYYPHQRYHGFFQVTSTYPSQDTPNNPIHVIAFHCDLNHTHLTYILRHLKNDFLKLGEALYYKTLAQETLEWDLRSDFEIILEKEYDYIH